MVFSSSVFLTLFLPLFLLAYYATPTRGKSLTILIGSYIFYGWWRVDFLLLFVVVTLFSYVISRLMVSKRDTKLRKQLLWVGVAGNLVILGYFKYFNFGVEAFNSLFASVGWNAIDAWRVILPIGISFYIFQSISYLVDVYRGDVVPARRFIDFAAFIALFPQLIAGPVLRYKDVEDQFDHRTHTLDKFNEGSLRFAVGFCKKVLIADTIAPLADTAFGMSDPTMVDAWLGIFAYTAQLYFDFSGYSDMAIGLGLMMGFRFIENFNHPYISRSITEFWRRWHISLSTWLRDYLYIPLGGNKKGTARTYINLFLTMFLGGIWHGAGWTFVLWGAWHGGWLAIERLLGGKRGTPYPKYIALPFTLLLVMMGWVAFRAENMGVATRMYSALFSFNGFSVSDSFIWQISGLQWFTLAAAYLWVFGQPFIMHIRQAGNNSPPRIGWAGHAGWGAQLTIMLIFLVAVAKMVAQSYSPFLYFQF